MIILRNVTHRGAFAALIDDWRYSAFAVGFNAVTAVINIAFMRGDIY